MKKSQQMEHELSKEVIIGGIVVLLPLFIIWRMLFY